MTWRNVVLAWAFAFAGCMRAGVDLYPDLTEHSGIRIDNVRFQDTEPFDADTLQALIRTQPSRCEFLGLPLCIPFTRLGLQESRLSPARVESDLETIAQFYRIAGYFGTQAFPVVERDGETVDITFRIDRGDPIVLDALTVVGTEPLLSPDSLAANLPLRPGQIFHLGRFIESGDRIVNALRRRGHANAVVFRSFTVDTIDRRAEASLEVVPGPRVSIDSVIVVGATHLGREETLRQMEFRPGDVLISTELLESQRNLYSLELVSLASVTVAPDSLQRQPPDSMRATVLVQVVEAPVHEIDAAVGFGTQECLRAEVGWVNRSFGGGARRLGVRASATRLGVGEPFAIDGGDKVCPTVEADSIFEGSLFDYRVSADFTQPYFLGPRNQLGVNAFGERLTEPNVFKREAIGGRVGVARRLGSRSGASVGIEVERGRTLAAPALFCAALNVCEPATIDSLTVPRFRNELAANYFLDHSNVPLDPTAGYLVRTAISWASPWLNSQVNFFRWTADGAYYRTVRPEWVAALSLRVGNFFRTATLNPTDNFLPPEERFYAGGATSVRGFDRNAVGPRVYVIDEIRVVDGDTTFDPHPIPTGGTALAVASVELRTPSPFLGDLLRLAVFADAGAIGAKSIWALSGDDWKITPGVGIRMRTPVGPVRLDIGYNPYDQPEGPLLLSDAESGTLTRLPRTYSKPAGDFLSRLRIHLGVGNPF